MRTTKICPTCKEEKPIAKFGLRSPDHKGVRYPVSKCRQCRHIHEKNKGWYDPVYDAERSRERYRKVGAIERAGNIRRAHYILRDCLSYDNKKGYVCDLDLDFINEQIALPCSYCADPKPPKMTLDRIDNTVGHSKANVVPACKTCNVGRGRKLIGVWIELCESKGYSVTRRAYDARDNLMEIIFI